MYHVSKRKIEAASRDVLSNKGALKSLANFTGKHLYWSLFLLKTPTQVFSYEICEIFKNTFFYRIPPVAAFEILLKILREKNY